MSATSPSTPPSTIPASSYHPTHFDPQISRTLVAAVKDWPDWRPAHYKERHFDTYQHITFRLRQGRITSISP